MATFAPIMQIHSEYNHHKLPSNDRTPWNLARCFSDPSILTIFGKFSQIREKLIPYLSLEGKSALETGRPLLAGLFFDFLNDDQIWSVSHQYLLGRDLLVAPVTAEGAKSWRVYLPAGDWVSLWRGEIFKGPNWIEVACPIAEIPVFLRAESTLDREWLIS